MTFSQEVKEELSKLNNLANKEELKYEFLGYISSDNIIIGDEAIRYVTESDYNIDRFGKIIRNIGFEDFDINITGKIFSIEISEKFQDILSKLRTSWLGYYKLRKYWKNKIAGFCEGIIYGGWFYK